ncbi:MAG: hypothetical protein CMJ32_00925 [Phycisphaerae bacterium]|nr:hypothetical protein [Phycisphaerae bacterium]
MRHTFRIVTTFVALLLSPAIVAADVPDEASRVQSEIDQLRSEIEAYRGQREHTWERRARSSQLRALVQDVIADASGRSSLQSSGIDSGWKDGDFTLASPSGDFTMDFYLQMQIDWIFNDSKGQENQWGFETRRLRLGFSGHIIDPAFTYNVRMSIGNNGLFDLYFGYMQYAFSEELSLSVGKVGGYFSREEILSSNDELGADYSFVVGQFDPGNPIGVQVEYQGDQLRLVGTVSDGWNQDIATIAGNQRMGLTARAEWKLLGEWGLFDTFTSFPGTEQGLMLGAAFQFDFGSAEPPASTRVDGTAYRLTGDVSYTASGFNAFSAIYWSYQSQEPTFTESAQHLGVVVQAGWFVCPTVQVYGRYNWGTRSDQAGRSFDDISIAMAGASWFPFEDTTIKLTLEGGFSFNSIGGWNIESVGWRNDVAGEDHQFIIRSQLQLQY